MRLELSFWGNVLFAAIPSMLAALGYLAWYFRRDSVAALVALFGGIVVSGMIDVCPKEVDPLYLAIGPLLVLVAGWHGWPRPAREVLTRRTLRRVLVRSQRLCLGRPLRRIHK